jgi:hypothetical protein
MSDMTTARRILASIPVNCGDIHPMASEGNMHDYIRASDKKPGKSVHHYAQRGGLFYVCGEIRSNRSKKRRVLGQR